MLMNPPINVIRQKADSRYTLVILAAKRARDLIDGKPQLAETETNVPISVAAKEIVEGQITYKRPGEDEEEPQTVTQGVIGGDTLWSAAIS